MVDYSLSRTSSCPPELPEKMAVTKKRKAPNSKVAAEEGKDKKSKGDSEPESKITEQNNSNSSNSNTTTTNNNNNKETSGDSKPQKQDYIHVRARRGQATDSHSLAERDDSALLVKQLREHILLLKSNLQDHSTACVKMGNNSYINELLMEPSGEPCLAADKMITFMGGYDGVSWLPTVDCYSPSTDIVRSLKPMSSTHSYASTVLLNGIIYNFGGWNGDHNLWYNTVESYNLSSNKWISCSSLSEMKGGLAGASLHNKIFAVGGGNGRDCFREVEVFVPAVGRWIRTQSLLEKTCRPLQLQDSQFGEKNWDLWHVRLNPSEDTKVFQPVSTG